MSNKLSQAEIDALVSSLVTGGAPAAAQPGKAEAQGVPAEGAAEQLPPSVPTQSVSAPFEEILDMGPITPAEVEAAVEAFQARKAGPSAGEAGSPTPPVPKGDPSPAAAVQPLAPKQSRRASSMAAVGGVLLDIELTVTVQLGRARLSLGQVLELGPGSVITLDKLANTPVDVKINGLSAMQAEVLAIGEKYGIRITQSNLNVRVAS